MKILLHTIVITSLLLSMGCSKYSSNQTGLLDSSVTSNKTYWLTIKSGIRHNSNCKYFHHSEGRPCDKNEGRACKICGG